MFSLLRRRSAMVVAPLAVGAVALGGGLAYAKHDKPPPVGGPPVQVGDVATSASPGSGAIGGSPVTLASVTVTPGLNYLVSASVTIQNGDTANGRRVVCDIQRVSDGTNLQQVQGILGQSGFAGSALQTQTLTLTGAPDAGSGYRLVCSTQSPAGGVTQGVDARITALRVGQVDNQ